MKNLKQLSNNELRELQIKTERLISQVRDSEKSPFLKNRDDSFKLREARLALEAELASIKEELAHRVQNKEYFMCTLSSLLGGR